MHGEKNMEKIDTVQTVKSSSAGVLLTEAARVHIKNQLAKRGFGVGIRLSVNKTGCSGLSYVVDFVDNKNEEDKSFNVEGIDVFIEKKSYPFLKGISMDYIKQGINHKFVFSNPNQTGECGCGESFTVDDTF
jgi:iron-sulfur cluster assembly protein